MRLARIQVSNFRNFLHLDIALAESAVIVGENKVGKTNLLFALRLVLDPSLPDTYRHLRLEDFHDSLPRPLSAAEVIEVSVEFTDFAESDALLAVLGSHLVSADPMVARLTYRFQAKLGREPRSELDYEFFVYGGDDPGDVISGSDIRHRIPLTVLDALRNVEGDLDTWRRSPLRPLLEAAASAIPPEDLETLTRDIATSTAAVATQVQIQLLSQAITERITSMVGQLHGIELVLQLAASDSHQLIRSLRLFIDGGTRPMGDASLGSANVLYLALKALEFEERIRAQQQDFAFFAVEEPEAHLHPHLQRLIYRDFLRDDIEITNRFVLVTTHSPHVASVAPLRSIVVLRADSRTTSAVSTANLSLTTEEIADLERYLDVTRAEMLFARKVLLVEGISEQYVIPVFAALLGHPLDQVGITVCAIGGTNFEPFAKLLGPKGLAVPHAVLTDNDISREGTLLGENRVRRLLALRDVEVAAGTSVADAGAAEGFFLNGSTFELELLQAGAGPTLFAALIDLAESQPGRARAEQWRDGALVDESVFLDDINRIGKGRFAQRIADSLRADWCPPYLRRALESLHE